MATITTVASKWFFEWYDKRFSIDNATDEVIADTRDLIDAFMEGMKAGLDYEAKVKEEEMK